MAVAVATSQYLSRPVPTVCWQRARRHPACQSPGNVVFHRSRKKLPPKYRYSISGRISGTGGKYALLDCGNYRQHVVLAACGKTSLDCARAVHGATPVHVPVTSARASADCVDYLTCSLWYTVRTGNGPNYVYRYAGAYRS